MTLILVYRDRGRSYNFTIDDGDGNAIIPSAGDLVRCRIGRKGQADQFSVTSGTPTAAGSSITAGETNRLRLDAGDLDFDPGTYTLSIEFFDLSDASEWKMVEEQVLHLEAE